MVLDFETNYEHVSMKSNFNKARIVKDWWKSELLNKILLLMGFSKLLKFLRNGTIRVFNAVLKLNYF
jgi:hypothetical protein